MTIPPVSEDDRRKYAFEVAFGSWVMAKQQAGDKQVDISQPTLDIMHFFFSAGWGWGKISKEYDGSIRGQPNAQNT